MGKATEINLVSVSNNFFSPLFGVLLRSLDKNYKGEQTIIFSAVSDGISESNQKKLQSCLSENSKVHLRFYQLEEILPEGMNWPDENSSFPRSAYGRLMIPYFLPKKVNKALYLDVDTLVQGDIAELWNINMEGHPIAAAMDRGGTIDNPWGGIKNYRELGLNGKLPYFNSGVMLMDLEQWRRDKIAAKTIEMVNTYPQYAGFADQYGLNIVLAGNWKQLPQKWNTYAVKGCNCKDAALIHYVGTKPIFHNYDNSPEALEIFKRTLQETPWRNLKPYAKSVWVKRKILAKISGHQFAPRFFSSMVRKSFR